MRSGSLSVAESPLLGTRDPPYAELEVVGRAPESTGGRQHLVDQRSLKPDG